jgi:hypothetical protein
VLLPATGASASPHSGPKHKVGRGTSTNWSGYAVNGASTHVVGTWTQPAANCPAGENSWSSPWVGIDGNNSSTVEQIGTDTDCSGGSPYYYAWYEMYPKPLAVIPTSAIQVVPGHSYTGEVTYTSGSFVMTLTDNSVAGSRPFRTTQSSKKAKRSSAEWVMEGPSGGLLTNFGTVGFTGASATVGGTAGTVGSFGAAAQSITMVDKSGTTRAVPTAASGDAFGVNWFHS